MVDIRRNNGHVEEVELTKQISIRDSNRIFELAVMIDQIQVPYRSDPLAMANEAIQLMQGYASEIAALARWEEL